MIIHLYLYIYIYIHTQYSLSLYCPYDICLSNCSFGITMWNKSTTRMPGGRCEDGTLPGWISEIPQRLTGGSDRWPGGVCWKPEDFTLTSGCFFFEMCTYLGIFFRTYWKKGPRYVFLLRGWLNPKCQIQEKILGNSNRSYWNWDILCWMRFNSTWVFFFFKIASTRWWFRP